MFKKILVLVLLSVFVSCGTSKSRIQTTKNGTAKNRTKSDKRKPNITTTKGGAKTSTASTDKKSETLESTSKTVVYAEVVNGYVLQFKETAKDNMKRHGIPASITLAQGILESGAGKGTLCVNANNHFGIKCHKDWAGESVYHDDDAAGECFRKYERAAESYNDHSLFLTTRGRYASLFELPKDDYKAWAHGLKAAGYATDPKYPDKLIGLIERYELAKYDAEVLGSKYVPAQKTETKPEIKPVANPAPDNAIAANSYRVMQGDTLYSISKKHNLTVDELMKLNSMSSNAISIGQVLKVK